MDPKLKSTVATNGPLNTGHYATLVVMDLKSRRFIMDPEIKCNSDNWGPYAIRVIMDLKSRRYMDPKIKSTVTTNVPLHRGHYAIQIIMDL